MCVLGTIRIHDGNDIGADTTELVQSKYPCRLDSCVMRAACLGSTTTTWTWYGFSTPPLPNRLIPS